MTLSPIKIIATPVFRIFFPLIAVGYLIFNLEELITASSDYLDLVVFLPYAGFVLTIALAHPFNQGRTAQAAFLMLLSYWVIQNQLQDPLFIGNNRLIFAMMAALLPLNLSALLILPQRRPFSQQGIIYFLWTIVQLLAANRVLDELIPYSNELWQGYLYYLPNKSPLPILLLVLSILIICLVALIIIRRNKGSDQVIFICLMFSTSTFLLFDYPFISSTFYSVAAILLIANIISSSHELAFIDQLTGILGRRALEDEMKHLSRKYTIAMLDIDHFKKFNDTHGHDTGDDVLRLVAKQMTLTNGGAQVYRYGGEEFTVLFKNRNTQQIIEHLEELRERIANYPLILRDNKKRPDNRKQGKKMRQQAVKRNAVNVTISIGVTDGKGHANPQEAMKAADNALYKAKKKGRNCVVSA
ncbi:diguanylate cyclase [Thaumasiovibrio sp. DFM-14]|uniref:GGDEF domain-containing protein n=1 Tax=Thaumasiovibrio sp. DFM-14 TaxID=3384792 RepID=UPI0039A101C3